MERQTAAAQIADAKAENYWAARERRNARRREEYAESKRRLSWPCAQCGTKPVMRGMDAGGHCSDCDIEVRRLFSPEEYEQMYGRR